MRALYIAGLIAWPVLIVCMSIYMYVDLRHRDRGVKLNLDHDKDREFMKSMRIK